MLMVGTHGRPPYFHAFPYALLTADIIHWLCPKTSPFFKDGSFDWQGLYFNGIPARDTNSSMLKTHFTSHPPAVSPAPIPADISSRREILACRVRGCVQGQRRAAPCSLRPDIHKPGPCPCRARRESLAWCTPTPSGFWPSTRVRS